MENCILVPTDFTKAANNALEHAIQIANRSKAKIMLLNLCDSQSKIAKSKSNLKAQIKNVGDSIVIETIVKIGDYKEIPTIAKEVSANVIIIGTHGAKGIQKIIGSNILKIVTNSETPFIIVQENSPVPSGYKKILVTSSFHFENKQKIEIVGIIAKYFNSEIVLIYSEKDPIMKKKALSNIKFMQKHLDKIGINHTVKSSSGKNFNADTITLGESVNANLIAIMNMQKEDVLGTGIFGKNYEQELITNHANIPVLIINPIHKRLLNSTLYR